MDIVTSGSHDYYRIVVEIAKKHPKMVVDAAKGPLGEPAWMAEVDDFIHEGLKTNAIKEWRVQTGVGLGEAKAAVEARMTKLGIKS
jgi:ribosomal protein L7/L12